MLQTPCLQHRGALPAESDQTRLGDCTAACPATSLDLGSASAVPCLLLFSVPRSGPPHPVWLRKPYQPPSVWPTLSKVLPVPVHSVLLQPAVCEPWGRCAGASPSLPLLGDQVQAWVLQEVCRAPCASWACMRTHLPSARCPPPSAVCPGHAQLCLVPGLGRLPFQRAVCAHHASE